MVNSKRVHLFYVSLILFAFFLIYYTSHLKSTSSLSPSLIPSRFSSEIAQSAQAAQDLFCKVQHPLKLDNVVRIKASMLHANGTVFTENVMMTVVAGGDVVSDHIIHGNQWETSEIRNIVAKMDEGKAKGIKDPVFLDIGSNIGYFSINMAARGYKTISIDAMKSNGDIYRTTLCDNPELMKHVTFFNTGLDKETKTCYVVSIPSNTQNGNVFCPPVPTDKFTAPEGYVTRGEVNLARLDELVKQDIYVLKIDTEGYEMNVFDGADGLFDKYIVSYIMSELSDWMIKEKGRDAKEYLRFWIDRGYSISRHGFGGPFLKFESGKEVEGLQVGIVKFNVNIYCVHKSVLPK